MIYLDTHVVVWLYAGLLEKFAAELQALLNEGVLAISPVVRLELRYLQEIGRVTDNADAVVADLGQRLGLVVCDREFNAVVGRALPLSWTRDPFDRLIVAHAALGDDILVTRDEDMRRHYPQARW